MQLALNQEQFDGILSVTQTHLQDLHKFVSLHYDSAPDAAFSAAMAAAIKITMDSVPSTEGKAEIALAINATLVWLGQPWRVVTVS